jgi:hypothetical protein
LFTTLVTPSLVSPIITVTAIDVIFVPEAKHTAIVLWNLDLGTTDGYNPNHLFAEESLPAGKYNASR